MACGKWLQLDKNYLVRPELAEILDQPDGIKYALIYCSLLINVGGVVPCDKKSLGNKLHIAAEEVQAALNAFYQKNMVTVTEKDPKSPPTLEEVRAYCDELESPVDPERFYDYYAADGFTYKGEAMDWKAKLRQWNVREKPRERGYSAAPQYGKDTRTKKEDGRQVAELMRFAEEVASGKRKL